MQTLNLDQAYIPLEPTLDRVIDAAKKCLNSHVLTTDTKVPTVDITHAAEVLLARYGVTRPRHRGTPSQTIVTGDYGAFMAADYTWTIAVPVGVLAPLLVNAIARVPYDEVNAAWETIDHSARLMQIMRKRGALATSLAVNALNAALAKRPKNECENETTFARILSIPDDGKRRYLAESITAFHVENMPKGLWHPYVIRSHFLQKNKCPVTINVLEKVMWKKGSEIVTIPVDYHINDRMAYLWV